MFCLLFFIYNFLVKVQKIKLRKKKKIKIFLLKIEIEEEIIYDAFHANIRFCRTVFAMF
jgi:hypothetical protein